MSEATCGISGCVRKVLARGWCSRHYQSWLHHGDPLATTKPVKPEICVIDGCDGKANEPGAARDWCRKHYTHWQRHGDPLASASCAGCGTPIPVGETYRYCRRPKCRRLYRVTQKANDPEKYRAMEAASRARQDKAKRRAAEKRYKARTDRQCSTPGCRQFARPFSLYCLAHLRERHNRRYARKRLKLPRLLYIRQVGLCPGADHGGCGLPLGDPDGNHVDHLIPEVRNGPQDEWNLQLMHPECNMRKSDSIVRAALAAAAEHGVVLTRPDGKRPRAAAA